MKFVRPQTALRMAAVMLHQTREPITACTALDRVLPPGIEGWESWNSAREWLLLMLPEGAWDCNGGWWAMDNREARLLGLLLAGDMAEEAGD